MYLRTGQRPAGRPFECAYATVSKFCGRDEKDPLTVVACWVGGKTLGSLARGTANVIEQCFLVDCLDADPDLEGGGDLTLAAAGTNIRFGAVCRLTGLGSGAAFVAVPT